MQRLRIQTAVEQVAEYLKQGISSGVWRGEMPGVVALAGELGVNHKTVEAALSLLVRQGALFDQGPRRPRRIAKVAGGGARSLRIGMLLYDSADQRRDYIVEIRHLLMERGHAPFFARRYLSEFGMDTEKVAGFVKRTPADAWVVVSAPRGVAEWFAAGGKPFFGLFGLVRRLAYAGAGPDKSSSYAEAARTLIMHGHRRIVLLARSQRREPLPGHPERAFLRILEKAGIKLGDYHFPAWENTLEGFHHCLKSMFQFSPPTALVVQEPVLFGAVQQFLAERGIQVPHDVSLVCDDPDPTFAWRVPSVAHIRWDIGPVVWRVGRWADHIALGKDDRRQMLSKAEFVPGGTIGPVKDG